MKRIKYNKWEYILDGYGHLRYIGKSFKPTQPIGLTDYTFMFAGRDDLKYLDLSSWDISKVTNLYGMFYKCSILEKISYFNHNQTSNVTNMSHMFYDCCKLLSIENLEEWNTKNLTDTSYMFYNCKSINSASYLQHWDLSKLDSAESMFLNCNNVDSRQLDNWIIPESANIFIMTSNILGTKYSGRLHKCRDSESSKIILPLTIDYNKLDESINKPSLFGNIVKYAGKLGVFTYDNREYIILDNIGKEYIKYIGHSNKPKQPFGCIRFEGTFSYRIEDEFDLSDWKMIGVEYTAFMFEKCLNLKNISSLRFWNTRTITIMSGMFLGCASLEDISPLKNWDLTNTSLLSDMFCSCKSLVDISPLRDWKFSRFSNISFLFAYTSVIDSSPLENWDYCRLDHDNRLNVFDSTDIELGYKKNSYGNLKYIGKSNKPIQPKNISCYDYMFENRTDLEDIDLSDWDMSEAVSFDNMFRGCINLKDISSFKGWNTSNVRIMKCMFYDCYALTDISALKYWNMSKVLTTVSMFKGCKNLEDIYPLKDWNLDSILYIARIFDDCNYLTHFKPINNWLNKIGDDRNKDVINSYLEKQEMENMLI